VKLQKRDNPNLFTKEMFDTPYNSTHAFARTYGAHRKALEFDCDQYVALQAYAAELGITFFATAFDFVSLDFLADLDMPAYKMASSDIINTPLLTAVAKLGKPMFVSTGGAEMADVIRAFEVITAINSDLCLLQCTSCYPPEYDELNLRVIESYRARFPDTVIGFSSHDNGIAMALVAYMLGARVVEKHFTLNRAWKGTDQAFSLETNGLRRMVRDLRRVPVALGSEDKHRLLAEEPPLYKMGKKLVAARDLDAGHVLTAEDIALKVPNDGLPPHRLDDFVGRTLTRPLKRDENFEEDSV